MRARSARPSSCRRPTSSTASTTTATAMSICGTAYPTCWPRPPIFSRPTVGTPARRSGRARPISRSCASGTARWFIARPSPTSPIGCSDQGQQALKEKGERRLPRRSPLNVLVRKETRSLLNETNPISIIHVEVALEARRRLFVGRVLHHVELATLPVDDRAGLDLARALFHGGFVLSPRHLDLRLVQPLPLGADHVGFAFADGPRFLGLGVALGGFRDCGRPPTIHPAGAPRPCTS